MCTLNLVLLVATFLTSQCEVVHLTIPQGKIFGYQDVSQNIRWFKGIPFGASTAGEARWMPPTAAGSWSGEKNCTDYGPACYSDHHNPDTCWKFPAQCSENCLNLNVWIPADLKSGEKLPVMLWIYGGSFQEGDDVGPYDMYDGSYIAGTKRVVIVTTNYRLGALGFLVTNELGGNFGLLDQRLAMQWVNKYISYFGGNPDDVTLWGESAGAMSIGLHMIMPDSWPYFHRAILESNPLGLNYKTNSRAKDYGMEFCKLLDCTKEFGLTCDTSCMRKANTTSVIKAWDKAAGDVITFIIANWGKLIDGFLQFIPNIDGNVVPQAPIPAFQSGKFHKIPVLLGTNTNEAVAFVYDVNEKLPAFLFPLAMDFIFGTSQGSKLTKYYESLHKIDDTRAGLSYAFTDFWFRCAQEKIASAVSNASLPAYVYRYNHVLSVGSILPQFGLPKQCVDEVCHASELPLAFHKIKIPALNVTLTPIEDALSTQMVDYWTNFVKTNNPNGAGISPEWPAYHHSTRDNIVIHHPWSTENSTSLCEMWDKIGYDY